MFNSSRDPPIQKNSLFGNKNMLKSILSRILLQGSPNSKLVLKTIKIITSSLLFVSIKASFENKKIINKLIKSLSCVKINTNIIPISLKSIALSPCRDCISVYFFWNLWLCHCILLVKFVNIFVLLRKIYQVKQSCRLLYEAHLYLLLTVIIPINSALRFNDSSLN